MKFKIEIDKNLVEDELIMKCVNNNKAIQKIQNQIQNLLDNKIKLNFYKKDVEYFISLKEILFFETNENGVKAHTSEDEYTTKYKLYQLEEFLPLNFLRVSKSTILNVDKVFSINKNITSSSLIEFYKTYKQIYVSRYYYKKFKNKINERRNYEN